MRALKAIAVVVLLSLPIAGCAHHHHHHNGEGKLTMDDLPQTVRDNFNRDHPNVDVNGVERETEGGVTHYEIDFTDQGEQHQAVYDREGDELKPDVKLP